MVETAATPVIRQTLEKAVQLQQQGQLRQASRYIPIGNLFKFFHTLNTDACIIGECDVSQWLSTSNPPIPASSMGDVGSGIRWCIRWCHPIPPFSKGGEGGFARRNAGTSVHQLCRFHQYH